MTDERDHWERLRAIRDTFDEWVMEEGEFGSGRAPLPVEFRKAMQELLEPVTDEETYREEHRRR